MDDTVNIVPPNCHILSNSPALHSLKRQQLVQLCKRNGIKATGKNAEIVQKLKAHALNHTLDPSSLSHQYFLSDDDDKENRRIAMPRPSEQWTVVEEDSREIERVHLGLKDIREEVEQEMLSVKNFGIVNSSAEFGNGSTSSKGSGMSSSLKSFATSLKRGASKLSTAPSSSSKLAMYTEEPPINDFLAANSTPYHAYPPSCPPLPDPQPLDADDSRDQSLLELGASTIRLVTAAPTAPSPPALRPFTPAFEPSYSPGSPSVPSIYPNLPVDTQDDPNPPGGFHNMFGTPANTSRPTGAPMSPRSSVQPFVFGSPDHKISNTEFHSAAASVLADMNARLGLTGTSNEVGLDILQKRRAAEPESSLFRQEKPRTDVTSKFDRAHEREFERMEGLGTWYAKRAAGSPDKEAGPSRKRKSDALGGSARRPVGPSNARGRRASRVITPATRKSLVAASAEEEGDGRRTKRVRISTLDGEGRDTQRVASKMQDGGDMEVDEESGRIDEERERERAAIKKKLEVSRARRRSSMGRVSVGAGRPPLIPNQPKKGIATKFGFLSSAKTLVKNVWNKGVGASGPPASKPASTLPVPKPSQAAAKKPTPNVLTKANPTTKLSAPKPIITNASTTKSDPNTSLRLPTQGLGLGRKTSARTGTGSSIGTRSSGATRLSTVSSTASSGVPAVKRGPIPSFLPQPGRVSRTSSLVSGGGTTGSRSASTASSRGSLITKPGVGASSIGLRKASVASDAGSGTTSSVARKRTSTLFAPTASSLAKMQNTVKPPSLSAATVNSSSVGMPKVDQRAPTAGGIPGFTFTSPPLTGGASSPSKGTGSIFSSGTPTFAPAQESLSPPAEPKPRALPPRRPRISRSRVIARLGAQRAASGSSITSTTSARRSLNAPKVRGSLGARASGIGAGREAAAAMSARKRLRQSEVLRRRSRVGRMSPALREGTPESGEGGGEEDDQEYSGTLEVSMEG